MDLSVSYSSVISFGFMYFATILFGTYVLNIVNIFLEIDLLYHYMIILYSLVILFALSSNLADMNIAMLAFCY